MTYTKAERLLTIKGLNLSYGEKQILRDINLHVDNIVRPGVHQGQVIALLGPSGVGKTQLFRSISGVQPFSSGEATFWLNGESRAAKAGEIGVVQQAYPLMNHRTVWGNLMLAAHGIKERQEEAERLLAHFGLSDKKGSYPLELSGGQRQRVAIVQQLVCASHFLMMDEPFSGLDVVAKDRVQDTIRKVTTAHEHNTVIFTTHDLETAVQLADELWVLGREEGKPGGTVIERIDLAAKGLAWAPNVLDHPLYWPTVKHLYELFKKL